MSDDSKLTPLAPGELERILGPPEEIADFALVTDADVEALAERQRRRKAKREREAARKRRRAAIRAGALPPLLR